MENDNQLLLIFFGKKHQKKMHLNQMIKNKENFYV